MSTLRMCDGCKAMPTEPGNIIFELRFLRAPSEQTTFLLHDPRHFCSTKCLVHWTAKLEELWPHEPLKEPR